eukprot:CAMPEP_0184415444 /NCGR_PEP_ID=MMETSP0738-20130409/8730_1 /TAXON_ID=385413 /ORGANISM="Thalassiosira miniscula, Strain CCMP1093" /LENGTH=156 /DNA_ID=CAMNT_0026774657 /DNA_START=45 /DNA_END=513 /DNA_ORIENTATION=-
MWSPRCLGGIHIKARAFAKVIRRVVRDIVAAGRGVWEDQRHALFCGPLLGAGFDHSVLMGAGQAREIPDDRHGTHLSFFWQKQAKGHVTAGALRIVAVHALCAAKARFFEMVSMGMASCQKGRSLRCQSWLTHAITTLTVAMEITVENRIAAEARW